MRAVNSLQQSVHNVAEQIGFSGVVRVDDHGSTVLAEAFGPAHRGFGIPNTIDTQFAIASGGKGFTALAVVSLIADGVVSLDTTARSVLGEDLPLIAGDVTVEHLLAHRSGIGDYLDEEDPDEDPDGYVLKSPVQALDTTEAFLAEVDGFPTKFPAGERFSYCNGGYIVLALIAERSSGIPYHDLVMQRVVAPAGLGDTGFLRPDEASGRMAVGYLNAEGLRANTFHLPILGNGDGGIYTTAADVHALWRAIFDGLIVPPEWVAEITRPRSEPSEEGSSYGLGFWLTPARSEVRLIGGDTGVSFYSAHNPETVSTWTVISNTTEGAWPMVGHLLEALDG